MARITRRAALGTLGAAVVGAPAVVRGRHRVFADSPQEYSARALRVVQQGVVVDLLNQFRFPDYSERPPKSERWLRVPGSFTPADAAVYHGSGINVFALGDGAQNYEEGVRFFADWSGFVAAYPDDLLRIDKAGDFEKARATGKVGILLSFQDSVHFRAPDDVDAFFGMGQRLSQLTYNFDNRIGSGFLERRDGGLSVFGLSILARMERVGMAVDISHCGDQTTLDALEAATKPIVITHANCRALVPGHLRCKTDEAIRKMARTGGIMGIGFLRFMNRDTEPVTIEHVLDHFDHVARLVGVQHVAVGSDLDVVGHANAVNGGGFQPSSQPNFARYQYHADADGRISVKGLDHPRRMFDLAEGLIRRGYGDADINLMLGGNAVRVLSQVWGSSAGVSVQGAGRSSE